MDTGNGFFVGDASSQDEFQGFRKDAVDINAGTNTDGGKEPNDRNSTEQRKMRSKTVKRKKVPKIYFGTRTHKQISQIVRELKKTTYKDTKMTILASREHTCIHPAISKMKNKTEGCNELIDRKKGFQRNPNSFQGQGCMYHTNVKTKLATHHAVSAYRGTTEAWDIEDLVTVGKKVKACPYFSSRELKIRSDIIFCPYNYLIEPLIRKAMEISVKNQVIILDEAHNIEDSAREGASLDATMEEFIDSMNDLEKIAATGIEEPEAHREMATMCSTLCNWMDRHKNNLTDYNDFNSQSKVWNGTEVVAEFQLCGLGPDDYPRLKNSLSKVAAQWAIKSEDESQEDGPSFDNESSSPNPKISTKTMNTLEGFITTLNYLFMKDSKHRDDFRVALVKTQARKQWTGNKGRPAKQKGSMGGWLNKSIGNNDESSSPQLTSTLSLNFWCLNPAVVFDELKENTRSIVLTSGTLSPMTSFSSELDVKFPIQLEASHVIDKRQLWISTISHGPHNICLNATYQNTESLAFQDEIGNLALGICQKVPHGVLLFFPSYKMLTKLSERWHVTGLWEQLSAQKVIVSEPRFSDEFESAIRHYYEVIESTTNKVQIKPGEVDGALFLAVCRGKVSEGLDFADNNARAVICIGIPFPNWKDPKVELKMKYNDKKRSKDQNILQGRQWYEIQAFRALNQALGRCIRHKMDWGAIVMVDDRYAKNQKYISSLSKWVRSDVIHYSNCNLMLSKLGPFVDGMVAIDLENKTKYEEEERQKMLEQKHDTLHIDAANQPSKGRKPSIFNNKNSNKRKPPVQYESDSSNDGGTPSGNTDNTFRNPSFSGKLKSYTEAQNISSTPKLGSFSGPNNRSEFFAKGPKNKRAAAMKELALNKKKANEDRKNAQSMKESPSSRLSALAGFNVSKEDIISNSICDGMLTTEPTKNYFDIEKVKMGNNTNDHDSNVPSDIQIGVDIPSDCTQFSKYPSSFNANRPFNAPLSDITSKTPISSNGIATKKKFKFSPSNLEVSHHSNSIVEAGDIPNIHHDKSKEELLKQSKTPYAGLNAPKSKFISPAIGSKYDKSTNNDSCISTEKSVKKPSSNLKCDRYNPNDYSSKIQVDSDDDFQ